MGDLTIGEMIDMFPELSRAFHRLGAHIPVDREMIRGRTRTPRRPNDAELIRMSDRWHRSRTRTGSTTSRNDERSSRG